MWKAQEACGEQLERANALIFSVDSNMCLEISTLIKRKVDIRIDAPRKRPTVFSFFGIGKRWSHGIRSISRRAPRRQTIAEYRSEMANFGWKVTFLDIRLKNIGDVFGLCHDMDARVDTRLLLNGCGVWNCKSNTLGTCPLPSHHWHYMRLSCLRFATRYHDTCNISRYTVWPTKVAMSSTEAIAGFHTILNPDFHFMAEIWCMAGVWYPTSDLKYVWKGLVNNEPSKPPVGKKTEHRLRKIASPIETYLWLTYYPNDHHDHAISPGWYFTRIPQRMQSLSSLFLELCFFWQVQVSVISSMKQLDNFSKRNISTPNKCWNDKPRTPTSGAFRHWGNPVMFCSKYSAPLKFTIDTKHCHILEEIPFPNCNLG